MAKKRFFAPIVSLTGGVVIDEPTGPEIGQGSADTTDEPFPCDFDDWFNMFGDDFNFDGDIDFDDYLAWWKEKGFSEEDWNRFNPDHPFKP